MSDYPNRKGGDGFYWLITLVLLLTGIGTPVSVLMIVLKLLGSGKKRGRHPYYEQRGDQHAGARTTGAPLVEEKRESPAWEGPVYKWRWPGPARSRQETLTREEPVRGGKVPEAPKTPRFSKMKAGKDPVSKLERRGKRWAFFGGLAAALCLIPFIGSLGTPLYWLFQGNLSLFIEDLMNLMVLPCMAAGGLGLLWAGLRKRKQASRYRSYLAMIGRKKIVSVSVLSSAIGRSPSQVRDDLADMLDDGLFPQGFLDYGGDRLVLTGDGITETPKPEPEAPPKADENAILAEIRAINDAIDNEKLSAQIDRVGVITARILDYQRAHPEKEAELHSFLSYYLPTTLKILRTYAQLEDQDVSGQNITAAMERIERMMDKAVDGFEKQLDRLFQGDAMDITADVEVLERMLAKDGLSDQEGLTLGL